ncbi:MAG: rod shape-determining protein MreC [Phycisphaerales bacterium]|nr:rod shape-determining protein MreC [Phycisphaerales bacterium]
MRRIILFFVERSFFFFFIFLETVSVAFLVKHNKYYNIKYNNFLTHYWYYVESADANLKNYFHLKEANEELKANNLKLLQSLPTNFIAPHKDSVYLSWGGMNHQERKYNWLMANIINNSWYTQTNFITIDRGASQGIKKGMAVVTPSSYVVGVIIEVSPNMSLAMSLINRNATTSCMLKNNNIVGKLNWDGKNIHEFDLDYINTRTPVHLGDTVVTSFYSTSFPPNLLIGVISKIDVDKSNNIYNLKVTSFANFPQLRNVYLIENQYYQEQLELEKKSINYSDINR